MKSTQKLAAALAPKTAVPEILFGTVTSVTAATATAAQVLLCDFEGQGGQTPCITVDSYTNGTPGITVGDYIVAIAIGPDTIVLGRLS